MLIFVLAAFTNGSDQLETSGYSGYCAHIFSCFLVALVMVFIFS